MKYTLQLLGIPHLNYGTPEGAGAAARARSGLGDRGGEPAQIHPEKVWDA